MVASWHELMSVHIIWAVSNVFWLNAINISSQLSLYPHSMYRYLYCLEIAGCTVIERQDSSSKHAMWQISASFWLREISSHSNVIRLMEFATVAMYFWMSLFVTHTYNTDGTFGQCFWLMGWIWNEIKEANIIRVYQLEHSWSNGTTLTHIGGCQLGPEISLQFGSIPDGFVSPDWCTRYGANSANSFLSSFSSIWKRLWRHLFSTHECCSYASPEKALSTLL